MNKISYNNGNCFVNVTTVSNGEVFFSERTVQVLENKDLANLRRVCRALSEVRRLQECLRKRYEIKWGVCLEKRMYLFLKIKKQSDVFRDFILKYQEYGEHLGSVLRCTKYFYSIDLMNSLVFLFQTKLIIDDVIIGVLNELSVIDHQTIKACFIENLLGYNDQAVTNNLKGFHLLKDFTIRYINTLEEQDRLNIKGRMKIIYDRAMKHQQSDLFGGSEIFVVHKFDISDLDSYWELDEQENSKPKTKEKEPKRKCIIS